MSARHRQQLPSLRCRHSSRSSIDLHLAECQLHNPCTKRRHQASTCSRQCERSSRRFPDPTMAAYPLRMPSIRCRHCTHPGRSHRIQIDRRSAPCPCHMKGTPCRHPNSRTHQSRLHRTHMRRNLYLQSQPPRRREPPTGLSLALRQDATQLSLALHRMAADQEHILGNYSHRCCTHRTHTGYIACQLCWEHCQDDTAHRCPTSQPSQPSMCTEHSQHG